jgi:hypothetical protein
MAPAPASPAIDNGTTNSLTTDQRGLPRPFDMPTIGDPAGSFGADAGAVEVQASDVPDPTVSVSGGPGGTVSDPEPTFNFDAQNAQQIRCSIDHGTPSYAPCGAGSYTAPSILADGNWTFHVRVLAITGAEATDSRSFAVDTSAPLVSVDSGPKGPTLDQTPTFSFSASEPVAFACRLGAGNFGPCTGPGQTHSPGTLADGKYTFEVRATDAAGNQSMASRSFNLTAAACRQALKDVIAANGKVAKAEQKLAKAKTSGNAKRIKKAKKALKKAKHAQSGTRGDVNQSCVTTDA